MVFLSFLSVLKIVLRQNAVHTAVADALVVPVGLAEDPFQFHAAFCHYLAGVGVIGIMSAFHTVCTKLLKKKTDNFCHGFRCDSLMPPAAPDAVTDMYHINVLLLVYH